MRGGDPAEAVADVAAGVADALHLGVLAVGVGELEVARLDLAADEGRVEQRLVGEGVHLVDEFLEGGGGDEVGSVAQEGVDRAGAPLPRMRSRRNPARSLAVMSGFCSEPESANSFSTIFWVRMNQEWSYGAMSSVVRRCFSVPRVS